MTGLEAWRLVAPIIGEHLKNDNTFDELDEAYVMTFCALTGYDNKPKGENEE